jgi:hypothetical protein
VSRLFIPLKFADESKAMVAVPVPCCTMRETFIGLALTLLEKNFKLLEEKLQTLTLRQIKTT